MSELRGRSRRLRKRGSYPPAHSPYQKPATSRKRRRTSNFSHRHNQNGQRQYKAASRNRLSSQQRSNSDYDPVNPGGLIPSSPGAIVKSSSRYQSRDGRRMPFGPDVSRRRPQVGAYAPAFNGRRSPTSARYASYPGQRTLSRNSRGQVLPSFPGAKAAGIHRPVQRLSPRPVAKPTTRMRAERPVRKPDKPTPPIVYIVRLLILGVGIGAIAGTTISVLNPAQREAGVAQSSESNASVEGSRENSTVINSLPSALGLPGSGRSIVTLLQLGQEMTSLSEDIQAVASSYSGLNPGVFLYDLDTTNYLSMNGDAPFSAASTIKVPVLVAFFQDVEAGRIKLDEILTMRENDVASGSGDMQFQPVGTEYTAIETATKMIIISDNTATNMLIRKMGGANALNQRFQSWGLTSTALRNPLPDLEGTNTTSPKDMVTLITLVSDGELISLRSRDQMLHIMERTQTNTLLPQGVGVGAQIAHKTGDIGSMVGDVGLVDMPNGKRYAIAALVQRPHNDSRAQELIRTISKKVYDALELFQEREEPSSTTQSAPAETGSGEPLSDNPDFFGIE